MRLIALYLTRLFLARFLLILAGFTVFILAVDLLENVDEAIEKTGGQVTGALYYAALRVPEVVSDFIHIAGLLAGLLTLTQLVRNSELTAIWNAGVSQFGMVRRLLPVAIILGGLQFLVDDRLVPVTSAALYDLKIGEYKRSRNRHSNMARSAVWVQTGNDVVRVPPEGIESGSLRDISIFLRGDEGQLLSRLEVGLAQPDGDRWELSDVMATDVASGKRRHEASRSWRAEIDVADLASLTTHPRQLSYGDLLRFSKGEAQGLWPAHLYGTWVQEKLAICLMPLLMIFLIIALAQRFQRTGHIEFLFISGIATGFTFFIFNGIGLALGEVGVLPPLVAGWGPLVIFATIAASIAFWYETHDVPGAGKARRGA